MRNFLPHVGNYEEIALILSIKIIKKKISRVIKFKIAKNFSKLDI